MLHHSQIDSSCLFVDLQKQQMGFRKATFGHHDFRVASDTPIRSAVAMKFLKSSSERRGLPDMAFVSGGMAVAS